MKVLLTCSQETINENIRSIEKSVLEFVFFPTIEFESVGSGKISLSGYEWLIISSRKVFDFLVGRINRAELKDIKIAAVGTSTKKYITRHGLPVEFTAAVQTGEGMALEFTQKFAPVKGKVLRPASELADNTVEDIFRKAGISIERINIYRPVIVSHSGDILQSVNNGDFDIPVFTSPSTWTNFKQLIPEYRQILDSKSIGVIGPVTAEALRNDGYHSLVMPEKYDLSGLLKKIEGELL
jgi:uroporphyrinogen-III synthase